MLASFLDKTVTHQRSTSTKDASMGDTKSWATQNAGVAAAIWPSRSGIVRDLIRRDISTDYVIATDTDLAAKVKDRFSYGGVYYLVEQIIAPYSNDAVTTETLYLYGCNLRTV